MLKISVCDDNPQFSRLLADTLRQLCAFRLPERIECMVGPLFNSAADLLVHIEKEKIDILFLDIDMPQINGFETAAIINQKHPDTIIIFVSSYDHLVFDSFLYKPLCFLRKSFLKKELPNAFCRAIEQCTSETEAITLKSIDGTLILRLKDILYFESDKNYYTVHCTSGAHHRCRGTLNTLSEALTGCDFVRTHSSYIINLAHVESVKGSREIEMRNHAKIPLTLSRTEAFHQQYNAYTRRSLFR